MTPIPRPKTVPASLKSTVPQGRLPMATRGSLIRIEHLGTGNRDHRVTLCKAPCGAPSTLRSETRRDGLKSRNQWSSRCPIKVLMRSTCTVFRLRVRHGRFRSGTGPSRCHIKTPCGSPCTFGFEKERERFRSAIRSRGESTCTHSS